MAQLTPQQERKLNKIFKIVEEGPLAIAEFMFELEDRFDEKTKEVIDSFKELQKTVSPDLNNILEQVKGKDSEPKVVAEILKNDPAFMEAVTPAPPKDGEDYILTDQDKKDIANSIKVPIVKQIIEKVEVIHEQPIIKTELIKETTEVSNETGETIVDKINELPLEDDKQIAIEHIKGWSDLVKKANRPHLTGGVNGIKGITAGSGITVNNSNFGYPVISATGGSILAYEITCDSDAGGVYTVPANTSFFMLLSNNAPFVYASNEYSGSGTTTLTLDSTKRPLPPIGTLKLLYIP